MTVLRIVFLASLLLSSACAPLYYPGPMNVAMLDQKGDLHGSAQFGTGGLSVDAVYGATDRLALRAAVQTLPNGGEGYSSLSAGFGRYWAQSGKIGAESTGWRGALSLESGPTRARSSYSLNGSSRNYEGVGLRTAFQLEGGYERPYWAVGLGLRPVSYLFFHGTQSDTAGQRARWFLGEAMLVARGGSKQIKVETQLGLSLPIGGEGAIGVPFPLIVSVGLTGDWSKRARRRD